MVKIWDEVNLQDEKQMLKIISKLSSLRWKKHELFFRKVQVARKDGEAINIT